MLDYGCQYTYVKLPGAKFSFTKIHLLPEIVERYHNEFPLVARKTFIKTTTTKQKNSHRHFDLLLYQNYLFNINLFVTLFFINVQNIRIYSIFDETLLWSFLNSFLKENFKTDHLGNKETREIIYAYKINCIMCLFNC